MESNEIGLLAVKAEATYGVDPVPTVAANLIPIAKGSLNWKVLSESIVRTPLDGHILPVPGFNTLPTVQVEFDYELRGNRSNGVVADISSGLIANKVEIDPMLLAANLAATYTAEISGGSRDGFVIYSPALFTTVGPSVAAYWWSGVKLHKLLGAKVNLNMTWAAGKMAIAHFTLRGKYVAIADAAFSTAGATWVNTKPPLYEGGIGDISGYGALTFSESQDNLNNSIVQRADPNDATGVAGFAISGTKPTGTLNPESNAEATHPFWTDWRASTIKLLSLSTPVAAGASGNRVRLQRQVELKDVNYGDSTGLRIHSVAFNVARSNLAEADSAAWQLKFY